MPLARYTMYAWGTQIYVAPTWDRGNPWLTTLRHIAKEGGVYVLGCSIVMRKDDIPDHFAFWRDRCATKKRFSTQKLTRVNGAARDGCSMSLDTMRVRMCLN